MDEITVTNDEDNEITQGIPKEETDALSKTVVQICNKFKYEIMRCINCPIILECSFPKKRLEPLKNDAEKMAQDIYEEEIELDNSAENTLRAQNKRDYVYRSYIQDRAMKVLGNDRCVFERQEILVALQKFVDAKYDITDPRVYLIVNELVSNVLQNGRMNKTFTNLGLIMKRDTPAGPIYYGNPLLKHKIEFSRLIIEATESLDRMLKSDAAAISEKSFTDHLLKELRIKESKKIKVEEVPYDARVET